MNRYKVWTGGTKKGDEGREEKSRKGWKKIVVSARKGKMEDEKKKSERRYWTLERNGVKED